MPDDDTRSETPLQEMINSGTEIAGAAAGGALGFFAGGPATAALFGAGGALAAVALRRIGVEFSERVLSPREKARTGAVLALATAEIQDRMSSGAALRDDGFFDQEAGGRAKAAEVAESIITKSQREPEERKLPYMAHLLASVCFDAEVSAEMAQQLTKIAEQLTYRQLCILKLGAMRDALPLRDDTYREQETFPIAQLEVLYECIDLYNRGLVSFGGTVAFGPSDVIPAKITPQGLGASLYSLMKLVEIPVPEVMRISSVLT